MKKLLLLLLIISTFPAWTQSTEIHPHLLSFPVRTTNDMNAITVGAGLRQGSTIYNSDLKTIAFYDGCQWQAVKKMPVNIPIITNLTMSTSMSNPETQLDWTHANPTNIVQYKVQRSINHGDWQTLTTTTPPSTSYINYNPSKHQSLSYVAGRGSR